MKIFYVSQDINNDYDVYSDFVIICKDEEQARTTHPMDINLKWQNGNWRRNPCDSNFYDSLTWVKPSDVKVTYLGEAADGIEESIICSSFHAG